MVDEVVTGMCALAHTNSDEVSTRRLVARAGKDMQASECLPRDGRWNALIGTVARQVRPADERLGAVILHLDPAFLDRGHGDGDDRPA